MFDIFCSFEYELHFEIVTKVRYDSSFGEIDFGFRSVLHLFSDLSHFFRTCYKEPQERLLSKNSQTKRILRLQYTHPASNVQHKSASLFLFTTLKSVTLNL